MTELILPRRKFLAGVGLLFAAPAIVRASNLMHVRPMPPIFQTWGDKIIFDDPELLHPYLNLAAITRKAFIPKLLFDRIYKDTPLLKQLMDSA